MSSLKSFTDTLQSIADKDDRIIMCPQEPDFSNARQLLTASMISARVDGNPDSPTRLAACRLTPNGALALLQWKQQLKQESFFNKFGNAILVCFGVCLGCIITLLTTDAYNTAKRSVAPQDPTGSNHDPNSNTKKH